MILANFSVLIKNRIIVNILGKKLLDYHIKIHMKVITKAKMTLLKSNDLVDIN